MGKLFHFQRLSGQSPGTYATYAGGRKVYIVEWWVWASFPIHQCAFPKNKNKKKLKNFRVA